MSPDVLAKAFDPFFTTKPVGRGSGLGLSMVYGFGRQSGGHVRIYSELGRGTTVKLYLPRWLGAADQPPPELRTTHRMRAEGQEAILVVEDDEEVRAFAVRVLRDFGYHVLEADNGADALKIIREQRVDLLFTDIGLPTLDGRQLVNAARELKPDLKVLFTTGYARNAIVHNGAIDPDVDLLPKPFGSEALGRAIRQILDRPSQDSPPPG
jgi:CheY-like chemotaxis protein